MPDIIHQVNCNLQWRQRQLIYAKQGDYGARKVRIYLYDGSNTYNVPSSGISAVFAYKRSDGFSDSYDTIDGVSAIELNSTNDYVTVTLAQQVLAVAGIVDCELQLLTSASLTATFTFQISVEASVSSGGEPHSQTTNPFVHSLADLGSGYAMCNTAAATAAKTATINGYTLTSGGRVSIRFDNAVPANATLNISDTGAKDIYYHGSKVGGSLIGAGDLVTFVYASGCYHVAAIDVAGGSSANAVLYTAQTGRTDEEKAQARANIGAGTYSKPDGGITIYDLKNDVQQSIYAADTAIQPQTDMKNLGGGIAQSTTQGGTVPKTATLSGYKLTTNGIVAVCFTTPVEASATLDINSTGAKAIYYHGSAISSGIISYGDTATFVYDGTNYNLIALDTARPPQQAVLYGGSQILSSNQKLIARTNIDAAEAVVEETVSGATAQIAPVANHIYTCGTLAALEITSAYAAAGDWLVEFDTVAAGSSVGTSITLPQALSDQLPSGFQFETKGYHYEINVRNGHPLVAGFPL